MALAPLEFKKSNIVNFMSFNSEIETLGSRPKVSSSASSKPFQPRSELQNSLRYVKGVGEVLARLFAKKDVHHLYDALYYFPRTYEDRREITKIAQMKPGQTGLFVGRIKKSYPVFYSRSRRRAYEVILEDPEQARQQLKLTWFSGPFNKSKLTEGVFVMARGEVKIFRSELQIVHPEIEILGKTLEPENLARGIFPVYSETEGLYQKTIRRVIRTIVNQYLHCLDESLPESVLEKYKYPSIHEAIRSLHFPKIEDDFKTLVEKKTRAHERLIYEEFFRLSIGLALKRQEYTEAKGIEFRKPEFSWVKLKENLPFQFTSAQRRVLQEILEDMTSSRTMHRLVQGDVGSGKTVVAAAAALVALENGYQVALMAPTEILVDQHYRNFSKWFQGLDIEFLKLTGSMTTPERRRAAEVLDQKTSLMVFGTHALFEDTTKFKRLGLVIVDEQHRFGVRQRASLISKGQSPDVLVMTATPIPRTLALTLYGDLDLSIIDELPPGRKPIQTKVFTERQRKTVEGLVRSELEKGHQAYVVYPLIEESEALDLKSVAEMLPHLKEVYQPFEVAYLHGKMKAEEKTQVLESFRQGKIHVLVSTTVVEVGVDIANATVMVVENAERFGLSQLHQLRGRIGRGASESFCFLLARHLGTEEIVQRLKAMEKTQDGFKLSEIDLEMRGAGEFLGTKQSGIPEFQLAELPRDLNVLYQARRDAFAWVEQDPHLAKLPALRDHLKRKLQELSLN